MTVYLNENWELWFCSKIKNCLVMYWGIVKSRSVMHFKGASVAPTELKKAKSKTCVELQNISQWPKCYSLITAILAVHILAITAQKFNPME